MVSLLLNSDNNININGVEAVTVQASNIIAKNNVNITSTNGDVNLVSATNTTKNTQVKEEIDATLSVGIGNAYVDTGYAAKALADATKNLKKSKEKLSKMKRLKSEGRASQKAVDLAITQVALATAGVATATANVAMAAQNAAAAASTSLGTGMYAAAYMDTTHHTDFLKTNSEQSVGSIFIAGNNIDINANKDYNQTGSILKSNSGDINIAAASANIKSGENTFQSEFGSKTTTASVSVGNNGVGLSAGYNQSDNFILQNTHTNSEILAQNGTFNLKTTGDANIKGGNVTANQVALNIGGDLNLETLQDTYEQQGSSFGLNIGVGGENPAINNAAISLGSTEIYKQTTGKSTGIISLASNDSNLSEAENLTNLLASNSVNVTGNISNQTVKEDVNFTNSDFEGTLSVPVDLLANPDKVKDAIKNLPKNFVTTVAGASSNILDVATNTTKFVTGNTNEGIIQDWKKDRTSNVKMLNNYMINYDRRQEKTKEGYDKVRNATTIDDIKTQGFEKLEDDKSIYHTYELDKNDNPVNIISGAQKGYQKYVHDDGYEIVIEVDKNKNILSFVEDQVNIGTYNHSKPEGLTGNWNHILLDVVPYFFHGNDEKILPNKNTPADTTWATDRILRTLHKPNNPDK